MQHRFLAFALLAALCAAAAPLRAQTIGSPASKAACSAVLFNDVFDTLSVNNLLQYYSNTGAISHNPATDAGGLYWPGAGGNGSLHATLMFAEGLVFSGLVKGEVRSGGATYRYGLQAGPILPNGAAADPADPAWRVYKARKLSATRYAALPAATQARLRRDFMEWPSALGAPWVDSDHNGSYNPNFDAWLTDSTTSDKPLFVGDEMLFFVSNDMDPMRTDDLYGTSPMGLEIRTLAWAFDAPGTMANAVFVKHSIINRSVDRIDDIYFGRWADPDLGGANDDLSGTDTTRDMMYVYNGRPKDDDYPNPPTIGVLLLQGPSLRDANAIGKWNFSDRRGLRNLRTTSSYFYLCGDALWRDPQLGIPIGGLEMRNNLMGRHGKGIPVTDPSTGQPVTVCHAGDPVERTGWIDGVYSRPCDQRILMGSGPVTMAPGDTQEVVFAEIVADGSTIPADILGLRQAADEVRQWYALQPFQAQLPTSSFASDFPESDKTRISAKATVPGATLVTGVLSMKDGSLVDSLRLYDDGMHGDGAAGDAVFANQYTRPARSKFGVRCALRVEYPGGLRAEWPSHPCLPLSGVVKASIRNIESDHLNFDHVANPGENIRVSADLRNEAPFPLGPFRIRNDGFAPQSPMEIDFLPIVPSQGSASLAYNASDSSTFLGFDVPRAAGDGQVLRLPVRIVDHLNQCWCDTMSVTARAFTEQPVDSLTLHAAGHGGGTLGWRLASRATLKDHTYRITVQGDALAARRTVSIADLTAHNVLATNVPFPDSYAHNAPLTDGWKITIGTAETGYLDSSANAPSVEATVTMSPGLDSLLKTDAMPFQYADTWGWGTSLRWDEYQPVRVVFSRSATQKAYAYLRGGTPNYGYQGYFDVPMRVFDISDSSAPRQLGLMFNEQNGGPRMNHTWDPASGMDREYLFILRSSYSDTPDPVMANYRLNFDGGNIPQMYAGWYYPLTPATVIPDGATITIRPHIPVTDRDTFYLNPVALVNSLHPVARAASFSIGQCYPNPIDPRSGSATAMIPLRVEKAGVYRIEVLDLLGRNVSTVFEGRLDPGQHAFSFATRLLPPGAYRIAVSGSGGTANTSIIILR